MRSLLLALLVTAFPCETSAQTSNIIRVYDRFEDRTRYWTPPAYVYPGLDLTVTFSFKGQGAGHDVDGFSLVFSSTSTEWRFLKNSRLYCLIDGRSVALGSAGATDNDVTAKYESTEVKERLAFAVDYQLLRKLTEAKHVEMRLGSAEFEIRQYVLSDIKELLSKVQVVPKKKTTRRG